MDFIKHLQNQTAGYKGEFSETIHAAPLIFQLLNDLTLSKEIRKERRYDLYVAMGYFIAPSDLYSEDIFGPIGYVDDILLSLYVLDSIKRESGVEPILDCWENSLSELEKLLNTDLPALIKKYPEIARKLKEIILK